MPPPLRVTVRAAALALPLMALSAQAQPLPARERFARGVALAAEGDWRTALLEFEAAYASTQNPEVLFNLAAAHEHLNEYVDALDALERYQRLAPPRAVAAHRAEVVAAMARLVNRIGALRVLSAAPSVACTVDGTARPIEALRVGLRVSAGRRVVRCEAPGFQPRAVTVDVTPNAVADALVDMVRVRATVRVTADRDGAEVHLDDALVGRTPLPGPLVVDEGPHRVELSLPGYEPVTSEVDARGDRAAVNATLRWRDPMPPDVGARLTVRASEPGVTATLDGRSVPTDGSRLLPPGAHRLRVEREDFRPVEREIVLAAGALQQEDVALAPTPAYRMTYLASARAQRRAWVVVGGAGVGLTVVGAVLFGVYTLPALDADSRAVAADAAYVACSTHGECNGMRLPELALARDTAVTERDALRPGGIAGAALLGAGLVGVAVGAVLAVGADPIDRFDRPPTFRVGLGPQGATLSGRF